MDGFVHTVGQQDLIRLQSENRRDFPLDMRALRIASKLLWL